MTVSQQDSINSPFRVLLLPVKWYKRQLSRFRSRLAYANALPQLTILGLFCGLLTASFAIAFRLLAEFPLTALLPAGSESFEQLSAFTRFMLPLLGALIIAWMMVRTKTEHHSVGIGHVLDRMQHHQGHMPLANTCMQFFGAITALLTGHSVGREGPAVHLGSSSSSWLGQQLGLPNNSLRILTACGVAAAIAASFNTPLAGVIFAMEVVLMEYTIAGFTPVILAAVSGGVLSRIVFGDQPAFTVTNISMGSLFELPFLVVSGLVIGLAASAMLWFYKRIGKFRKKPPALRMLVVGLLCGTMAVFVPQIQGVGYDTVNAAMHGSIGIGLLLSIAAAKIFVSTFSVALGLPGGIISPTFVVGACLGGAFSIFGENFFPEQVSSSGFYAVLGMGAMMAAVLNAPLAALVAVLELTYNPNILLPSMLVTVVACLTCRTLTKLPGIFSIHRDLSGYDSPLFQMLSRSGVTSLMKTNLSRHSRTVEWENAHNLITDKPEWILIEDVGEPKFILRPADLARYIEEQQEDIENFDPDTPIDLREIPGERWRLFPIHSRATLQEALMMLEQNNAQAAYVSRPSAPLMSDVAGVLTRKDIDNFYH